MGRQERYVAWEAVMEQVTRVTTDALGEEELFPGLLFTDELSHAHVSCGYVCELQMLVEDPSLRLVVLEIGCGTRVNGRKEEALGSYGLDMDVDVLTVWPLSVCRSYSVAPPQVPSVRKECEMVVADLFERCGGRDQATLIRVNPDVAHCDHPVLTAHHLVLSIPTTGLEALEAIDQMIHSTTETGLASSGDRRT